MRNSVEITRKYQFGHMLVQQLKSIGICFIFQAMVCWWFLTVNPGKYIVGILFGLINAGMLFAGAKRLANFDRKPYTPLKPEIKWGFYWGIMLALASVFFMALHIALWDIWGTPEGLTSIWAVLLNILFFFWHAPYYGLMQECHGTIPLWLAAIFVIVPLVMCPLGYKAGMKNFDVLEKLDSLTFEKDEDEE